MKTHKVIFKFSDSTVAPIEIEANEGDTILEVAMDNFIDLHHNCGGVCACTTCHVYIESGMECLSEMSDREEDYLDRAADQRLNSRLGCQCKISGDIEVQIPDQSQYLGH